MYYRHQLNYAYPDKSDEHMISVKHLRDTHFDENYQYLPNKVKRCPDAAARRIFQQYFYSFHSAYSSYNSYISH